MISLAVHKLRFVSPSKWLVDVAICIRTWSLYPHVELLIQEPGKTPLRFSASRQFGVGFEDWKESSQDWDIITLSLTPWQEAYARNLMNGLTPSGYGWNNICHFLFPWVEENINTYDCSSICAAILTRVGYLGIAEIDCWRLSPDNLRSIVLRKERCAV